MKYVIVSIDDTRESYKQAIRSTLNGWDEIDIVGVNGNVDSELKDALIYHGSPKINRDDIKVGQLGRWLSYLDHLDIASEEPLLVIEDDAVLAPDFIKRITPLLNDMPADADFFSLFIPRNRPTRVYSGSMYPAYKQPSNGVILPAFNIGHDTIIRSHQPYGGVAMVLYPGMRDKILADIKERGICGQFDDELYLLSAARKVNGYSIVPDFPDLVGIIPGIPSTVHETKFYGEKSVEKSIDPELGPYIGDDYSDTLRYVLSLHPQGHALEFGVATGATLALIAKTMPAVGFDSFQGLPEDWREGFGTGRFACRPPLVNAELVIGLFEDTLPEWTPPGPIGLVHIDCDLYSSTATVLEHIGPYLQPGCYIVFDEWHNYPGCEQHEQLAWSEYITRTGASWKVIGHGPEQLALQLSSLGETEGT